MCKECEKRGGTMSVAPLKISYYHISDVNIKEFCAWFREKNIDIAVLHFTREGTAVTIGLESEVALLEQTIQIPFIQSRYARYEEVLKELLK